MFSKSIIIYAIYTFVFRSRTRQARFVCNNAHAVRDKLEGSSKARPKEAPLRVSASNYINIPRSWLTNYLSTKSLYNMARVRAINTVSSSERGGPIIKACVNKAYFWIYILFLWEPFLMANAMRHFEVWCLRFHATKIARSCCYSMAIAVKFPWAPIVFAFFLWRNQWACRITHCTRTKAICSPHATILYARRADHIRIGLGSIALRIVRTNGQC